MEPLRGGRHGLGRDAVAQSQRSRILEAIVAAVDADGYVDATLTDVTQRSRVSRKTFYEHFASKEECFIAAFEDLFADLLAVTLDAFRGDGPWPDRMAAALRVLLRTLQKDRLVAKVCFVEALSAGPHAARVRNEAMARFAVLYHPEPADQVSEIDRRSSQVLAGGFADVVYRRLSSAPNADLRELLPDLLYPALTARLGPDDGRRETARLTAA